MDLINEDRFSYLETSGGPKTLLLLHGLFGGLSNFSDLIEELGSAYHIVFPILPILDLPIKEVNLGNLVKHVEEFIQFKNLDNIHVLGNSLGGHIAQILTLQNSEKIKSMILTGSSGLFENAMGSTFPKRGNYEFIKAKTESTFYDPKVATKELVDEVFETVNDRMKAIKIIATAKSAIRQNLGDKLSTIKTPTLLIWGKNDVITPAFVGEKFKELLDNSELHILDKCGHAPMMEKPKEFIQILTQFLEKN